MIQEIENSPLSKEDLEEIKTSACTNCHEKYEEGRNIMVAKLKKTTIWWHSPHAYNCYPHKKVANK